MRIYFTFPDAQVSPMVCGSIAGGCADVGSGGVTVLTVSPPGGWRCCHALHSQQPTPSWPEQVPRHRHPEQGSCSHSPPASRGWLSQYRGAADDAQVPSPTSPYLTLPSYIYPDLTHFSQRQIIKINPTWRLHLVYASVSDNEYYEHAMIQLIH